MATGHKTGGRRKGSRNKNPGAKRSRVQRAIEITGQTPLEYLMHRMQTHSDEIERFESAKAAAPYIHAKKVEQANTHVFTQFGERLDQMNRRDKDYKHGEG